MLGLGWRGWVVRGGRMEVKGFGGRVRKWVASWVILARGGLLL